MSHGFIADEFRLHEDAFDSYRTQQVTFESDSGLWRLEPSEQVSGVFPFAEPVYVISAWHPNGFPASWDQNTRYSAELATNGPPEQPDVHCTTRDGAGTAASTPPRERRSVPVEIAGRR